MTRATATISALLGALALAPAAAGAPGDLDGSFSGDGWLRTLEVRSADNNYLPRGAEDVAVQPDGRIVAVGELIDGTSHWYFGAFRYLPNGELDPSFGKGGWVDTDFGSGRILAAGVIYSNLGLARYLPWSRAHGAPCTPLHRWRVAPWEPGKGAAWF